MNQAKRQSQLGANSTKYSLCHHLITRGLQHVSSITRHFQKEVIIVGLSKWVPTALLNDKTVG